jgi:hypothetical protein
MPYVGRTPSAVPVTADDIPANSIDASKIVDGAITIADIADDAVTAAKLANSINTEIAANTAKTGITSGQASAITANTAKVTNATHTGDVTGATALTIADNAVTLAKMAGGTDGQIITYDASGNPVTVGPGTDGQVLTSTGAGSPPAFETAAGGKVLQVAVATFTAGHVTSTNGSNDVSSTDGYGLFATSFTPTSASSKIIISSSTVSIHEEANNYNSCWVASFYDTTRIAVTSGTWHSNSNFVSSYNAAYFSINHSVSSWGTTAKTINIRAGMDGSSGTFHINGSSLYNMGGQAQIGLTIMEVEV